MTVVEPAPDDDAPRPRGVLARLVRFVAWVCTVIGILVLASVVATFAPCFAGTPDTCVSGLLLLAGVVVAAVLLDAGVLLLAVSRRR